jgi:hypothetical protein
MSSPIDFDDEPRIQAYEIDDVPVDRMLASELPMRQLPVSEGLPQQVFRTRLTKTKLLRS